MTTYSESDIKTAAFDGTVEGLWIAEQMATSVLKFEENEPRNEIERAAIRRVLLALGVCLISTRRHFESKGSEEQHGHQ